jgi:cyclophilin family peptidyl-prolyl cis-trans isomerase
MLPPWTRAAAPLSPPPSRLTLYPTPRYGDVAPGTVENFAMIALGQTPGGLTYKGSKFHRVIENFMVQGGDIINGDGTGSFTVWDGKGGKFADENLQALKHDKGTVSMANSGPNTNGAGRRGRERVPAPGAWLPSAHAGLHPPLFHPTSPARPARPHPPQKNPGCQFFITTVPTPWLDGKHQVFGRVLEGMDLVEAVSHIEVDKNDRPLLPVIIRDIGEIRLNGADALPAPTPAPAQTVAAASVPDTPAAAGAAASASPAAASVPQTSAAAPELKQESSSVAAAGSKDPAFTKYIYFDLQQDGVDLGRLLFGL